MSDSTLHNDPAALPSPDRLEGYFLWFFAGAFVLFLFFYGILPIYDPDFWWHLKTGEVMAKSGGLLNSDPFNFSGDGVVSAREVLILKGYWLWDLSAYALYDLLGLNGISVLNLLTILTMAGVVIRQLRRQQVAPALAAMLLTAAFYLVRGIYPMERPQMVSFLLASILLVLLARVRDGGSLGWTLPLLMVIWANLHGGFAVGDLILVCFAAGACIEYRQDLPRLRSLLLWVVAGIVASLLNPTGALVFGELFSFHNSALMKGISEYQGTWVKYQQGFRFVSILWGLIFLYVIGIWRARRLYWPEFFVALFLAYISVFYLRNIGFFAIAMMPVIGLYLQSGTRSCQRHLPVWLSPLLLGLCALFLLWNASVLWRGRHDAGPVQSTYPEKAISFFLGSGLKGRVFNDYTCGGYLLWRLPPEIKIFIDGRQLENKVFEDWLKITAAEPRWVNGRREFELLLDSYAIDYISQPIHDENGRIPPLLKNLLNDPGWVPVYLDTSVYILARNSRGNVVTIAPYGMDKNLFQERLLMVYDYLCQQGSYSQVARAEILLVLAKYQEAQAQIEAIMKSNPNNSALPELQSGLEFLKGRLRQ